MKKALFIMGGPRKKGNLASMLNIAMEKAKDAGYELHYVNLYEKNMVILHLYIADMIKLYRARGCEYR